jgi:hypothetical protein
MGDNSKRNKNLNLLIGHPFSPGTLLYLSIADINRLFYRCKLSLPSDDIMISKV